MQQATDIPVTTVTPEPEIPVAPPLAARPVPQLTTATTPQPALQAASAEGAVAAPPQGERPTDEAATDSPPAPSTKRNPSTTPRFTPRTSVTTAADQPAPYTPPISSAAAPAPIAAAPAAVDPVATPPTEPATAPATQPIAPQPVPETAQPLPKPDTDTSRPASRRAAPESSFKLVAEAAPQSASPSTPQTPVSGAFAPPALVGPRSAASAVKSAASAPAAQSTPNLDAAQASATRGLAAAVQQRGGSVTIRLSPESLGNLKIEMSLQHGSVTVDLRAATPEAHELLSQSIGTLRSSLEARGLSVERLNVHLAPAPQPQPGSSASGDQQQQPGWREDARTSTGHDAGGGASRGRDDSNQHQSPGGAEHDAPDPDDSTPFPSAFTSKFRLALDAVA